MDVDGIPSTSTDQPPLFQQDATMNAEAAAMEAVDVDALLPPELIFAMIMSWRGTKVHLLLLRPFVRVSSTDPIQPHLTFNPDDCCL